MDQLVREQLGLTWPEALAGMASGVGIYLAVIALTPLFGQRSLASHSSFDFPVTTARSACRASPRCGTSPPPCSSEAAA